MSALVIIALLYAAGAVYGTWIGGGILLGADCDHAWLTLFPLIIVGVLFWPLTLLLLVGLRLTGDEA